MIMGFAIQSICTIIFASIGVWCRKSKKAVGFFTFAKPPTVDSQNVQKYNNAVSLLWFIAAILLEIIGIPFLYVEQNSPIFVFMPLEVMILSIFMMIAYVQIEAKYKQT